MSYCRWSSDNWKCDLYCYEYCEGGWTTHVASNRIVGDVPQVLNLLTADRDEWVASHKAACAFLDTAEHQEIGLPYDGETFNDPTLEAFRDRLMHLRYLGYNFPNYMLQTIDDEIAEEQGVKK